MAVPGEVGGSCHAPLQEQDEHCAENWLGPSACCSARSRQGAPAGEGGEAALPRGECSPARCWRGAVLGAVQGRGALKGMTAPAPALSMSQCLRKDYFKA